MWNLQSEFILQNTYEIDDPAWDTSEYVKSDVWIHSTKHLKNTSATGVTLDSSWPVPHFVITIVPVIWIR